MRIPRLFRSEPTDADHTGKGFGPPQLEWKPVGAEALLAVRFEGKDSTLRVAPIVDVALKIIKRGDVHYRRAAYSFLKYAVAVFLKDGLPVGEPEETFGNILRGLFDATRVDEFTDEADQYILDLAKHIFAFELGKKDLPDNSALLKQVLPFLPLSSALLEGIIENLCSVETHDLPKAAAQTQRIIENLLKTRNPDAKSKADPHAVLLHQLGSKLCSLCYEQSWQRASRSSYHQSVSSDLGPRSPQARRAPRRASRSSRARSTSRSAGRSTTGSTSSAASSLASRTCPARRR